MANNNTYVFGADDKQLKAAIEGLKNNFNSLDDAIKGTQKKLSTYLEKSSELEKLNDSIETQKIKVSNLKKVVENLNRQEEKNKDLIASKTKLYKEEKTALDHLIRNYNAQNQANNKRIQAEKQRLAILKEGRSETEKDINATKKQTNAIEENSKAKKDSKKQTSNATNAVVRHLRQIETLVVAYYTLSKGFQNTIGIGIQVSRMVEDNTSGIAALLSANTRMILSNGETVDSYEKFKMGLSVAKDTMEDLRKASVKTYATFPQLTEIFQQAIGQTLSMGDSFGKTTDEIISNTIKLSQRMSNIAGAIGMPMDRVREEIRSILSGSASTDSLISTMLFGSPGEANKAIRLAKQRGANGVKEMLDEMLKPFDALSTQKTFTRSLLALEDAWKNTMMKIVQDSGAFKDIQNIMDDMTSSMNDNIEEITKSFDTFYNTSKQILSVLDDIAIGFALYKVLKPFPNPFTLWIAGGMAAFGIFDKLNEKIIEMQRGGKTQEQWDSMLEKDAQEWSSEAATKKRIENSLKEAKAQQDGLRKTIEIWKELGKENKQAQERLSAITKEIEGYEAALSSLEKIDNSRKRISNLEEQGKLLTKIGLKNEVLDKIQKEINKDQSKTVSLEKEIIKLQDIKLKGQKVLSEAKTVNEIKTAKKAIETIDQALLLKREKLAEVQAKELQKLSKEEAIRFKIKSYMDGSIKLESYQQDLQTLKIQALNKEFATLQKKEDKEAKLLEILKEQAKLEEMIYKKELKDDRSLDKLFKETEKYKIKIELDGYGEVNKQLDGMYKAYKDIAEESKNWNKYTENYNKLMAEAQKQGKDTAKYKEQYNKNEEAFQAAQIVGYANIAGAMSKLFKEGSDGANAMMLIQSGLATVNAVNAVLAQGQGDPYSAFGRMAAMAATAATLLSNIGKTFNSGSEQTVSYDSFSSQKANEGTGSSLGDAKKSSESILNSLNTLESFAKPEFNLLSEMNKSLLSIDRKMGGVAGLLINQGGFQVGAGFAGSSSSKQNIRTGSMNIAGMEFSGSSGLLSGINTIASGVFAPIAEIIEQKLLGGGISKVIGGLENKILGGLFGKVTSESTLADAGIMFGQQLLSQALEDFNGRAYQTIATTVTKKSWFKKSSSTSYSTVFEDLNEETERQFSLVLNSLYDTVLNSGTALDVLKMDIESELSDFYVDLGKISLKGKTGEEIQKNLSSIFGKLGDELAKEVFPFLTPFQQVGEGMFETMTRVSTGIIEAEYYLSKLGVAFDDINHSDIMNPQGEVGFEGLYSGIVKTDESIYGVNNNIVKLIQNLNGTTEELYTAYTALESLRTQFKFLGHDFEGITSDMIAGSGGIENLRDSINSYIENFYTEEEQLVAQTNLLTKEFAKFNIEIPKTKDGFKEIIEGIDLTTKEGQELYGRLISLSGSFSKLIEDSSGKIKDKMTILFETMNKGVENIFDSISRMSQSTKEALEGLGTKDTFSQLVEYNKKLKEFRESRASGDTEGSESLYNELLGLSKGIAGESQYEKAIRDTLSSNLSGFELEKQTLRVNIVEGLGELLSLNSEQVEQLKTSVEDGKATNEELNSITGITQEQKDGIIEFSNNSNYFSTEKQQENANELMKLQLQALKQQSAIDTDPLSSKSFEYGDVIGKQEQKDIATLYGTSYENIAPFIENIQSLEVSQDKTADLKQMLGFTGTSINEDVYSNIQKLSPYIGGIATQAQAIKFEAEKNNFIDRISAATASFVSTDLKYIASKTSMIESLKKLQIAQMGDVDKGIGYAFTGTDEGDFKENYNKYKAAFDNTYSFRKAKDILQESILKLNEEKLEKGYYQGGFTGYGNPTEVAGVVHKSEYVVNHSKLNSVGGAAGMEALLNGNLGGTFRSLINGVVETNKAVINELSQVKEATTRMIAPLVRMSTNQQVEMSYLKNIQDSVEQ